MTPDPASLLPIAMRAADMAAEMMRNRRPASLSEKHDRDLVSDVDVAIERQIRSLLEHATPEIGVLGEEEGQTGKSGAGWLWTLDPIDGTSNFAHGIPLCASSLALLHDGTAVLGVIDAPFLGQRYHAVEGHGAFSGDHQLSVSVTRRLKDAIVVVGDYATGPGADRENELRLAVTVQLAPRVHRLRMIGTAALDLAWVAEGRLDGSITLGNKPWDTAAGVLIAREAGAQVVDADGSPHNLNSAFTIAAPPALVDQLILLVHGVVANDTTDSKAGAISPYAQLDAVLSAARNVIFDFDGPICDFTAALPDDTTLRLRSLINADAGAWPGVPAGSDPYDFAGRTPADDQTAAKLDAELSRIELESVADAVPAAYAHEAISACRDSGRTPAVIGRQSTEAVRAWLTRFSLADQIQHVAAGSYQPGHRKTGASLLEETVRSLSTRPQLCALITSAGKTIETARSMGLHTIGYAATTDESAHLYAAGAEGVVLSLADLTLRLRAKPIP
jgi:myo-inositol-1(or 4)-monophosphatase